MRYINLGAILFATVLATGAPAMASPFGDHAKASANAAKLGDYIGAVVAFEGELHTSGDDAVKAVKRLKAVKGLPESLVTQAKAVPRADPGALSRAAYALDLAQQVAILAPEAKEAALGDLRASYVEGVKVGTVRGVLGDYEGLRPAPGDAKFEQAVILNTAKAFEGDQISSGEFEQLLSYAKASPARADNLKFLEATLPSLQFSIAALRTSVNAEYPTFAARELRQRVTKVFIDFKTNPLFGLDLRDVLRSDENVDLVLTAGEADAVATITELGLEITPRETETQTVRYAKYEVQFLAAIFMMPDGATYQFENTKGGIEYEYAFNIALQGQGISDEFVLRKRGGVSWSNCSGQRVVNVFGGSQPADWIANSAQRDLCGVGGKQSLSEVRRQIAKTVADDMVNKVRANRKRALALGGVTAGTH